MEEERNMALDLAMQRKEMEVQYVIIIQTVVKLDSQ